MKLKVEKQVNPNLNNYDVEDLKVARKFTKIIYDEFGDFLKAVVLFGSSARQSKNPKSDIDILIIVDDVAIEINSEIAETFRIITEKAVVNTSSRLHITSMKFTSFWEYVRNGDPVGINILRDGIALVDVGFFDPMQIMLRQGRVRPSLESIYTYMSRAPKSINHARLKIIAAVLDLYWAVIDAAHAALMSVGEIPPSPQHVGDLIKKNFVDKKILPKKYVDTVEKFYKIQKNIQYREIRRIEGSEFDKLVIEATQFVDKMQDLIEKK